MELLRRCVVKIGYMWIKLFLLSNDYTHFVEIYSIEYISVVGTVLNVQIYAASLEI
jgi:hypothetical protein